MTRDQAERRLKAAQRELARSGLSPYQVRVFTADLERAKADLELAERREMAGR